MCFFIQQQLEHFRFQPPRYIKFRLVPKIVRHYETKCINMEKMRAADVIIVQVAHNWNTSINHNNKSFEYDSTNLQH